MHKKEKYVPLFHWCKSFLFVAGLYTLSISIVCGRAIFFSIQNQASFHSLCVVVVVSWYCKRRVCAFNKTTFLPRKRELSKRAVDDNCRQRCHEASHFEISWTWKKCGNSSHWTEISFIKLSTMQVKCR